MKKSKLLFIITVVILAVFVLAACGGSNPPDGGNNDGNEAGQANEKLKIAFVYNGSIGDDGWCAAHEVARQNTQARLDFIETSYIEPVTPGTAAEQVFSELGQQGYDVVVAATMAYESDVNKIAPEYPNTIFLICSGSTSGPNVESFWPDRTALWYSQGVIAGLMSETNKIGFTGSNPIPLVLCVQNAFLLGAQRVNPEMTQAVVYIQVFYDPPAETDAAKSLAEAGCDILWNNTDTPSHVQIAEQRGLHAFSQYADQREFGPNSYIGGEFLNWEAYYVEAFQKIWDGAFTPQVYFPDMKTEACLPQEIINVPADILAQYQEILEELLAADDMYSIVYSGPIYDNNGVLRVPEGEYMTKEEVQAMDWFVQGTISSVKL